MVPAAGAWSNRVYRLSTDLGSYAVKELLNPGREPSWLDSLHAAWRFELAAQAAGVAIPVPVPSPSGGCVAWVEQQGRAGPVPVRLHAWVEGTQPGPAPVTRQTASWAGRTLATLHLLGISPADRSLFPVLNTRTADEWPDLVSAARLARVPWADQLAAIRPVVARDCRTGPRGRPGARRRGHDTRRRRSEEHPAHRRRPVLCDGTLMSSSQPDRWPFIASSEAGQRRGPARGGRLWPEAS